MKTNILSKAFRASVLVCLILLSFGVSGQVVGDYRTKGTGALNWGVAANWERCVANGDWTGATSTTYPGEDATAGTVTILDGAVVTLNVSPANSIAALAFDSGTTTATSLTITGQSLTVTGGVTFINPGGSNGDQTLTIGTGTLSCASIDMPDTGADNEDLLISISTGTITVSGSITMNGSSSRNNVTFSSTGTINVGGDFSGGGFTCSTSTVNYNGTGAQIVGSYAYNNLVFTNSSIKTLQDDATAGGNLTVNTNASFNIGATATAFSVTGTATINGTLDFGDTSTKTVDITGSLSGTGTIDMSGGSLLHILNLGGATNTIGTLTTADAASTINYNRGDVQTVFASLNYRKLNISGSGTKTLQGDITVNNDLDVLSGTFSLGASATTVSISGNTNVDGTLNLGTTTKTTSISGSLTVDGTLNFGSAENTLSVTGNLIDVSGTITMQGTGLAHTLNLSGATNAIGTFNTTDGSGSTVNYSLNGAQTGFVSANYQNLTLSGTGIKTFATTPTVKGVLSMDGDATVTVTTGVITYGTNATLRYNTSNARTASAEEWITPFAASGGVIIDNTGEITLNASKTFNSGIHLTINPGANLNTSAANNYALTFGGNFDNNGTLTANASNVTINTTYTPQSIDGFTTTGTVSMTKTGGTATLQGNVSAGNLTINGSGGTLNLGAGLSHYITGTWTRTAGTLNGGSSTLYIAGSVSGTGGTFTAGGGTVNYNASGDQNIPAITYNNLSVSGSGTKTAESDLTVNGVLTVAFGCTLDLDFYSLFGTLSSIANSGTIKISDTSGTPLPTGKTWNGIVEYANTTGSQTIVGGTYENLTFDNTSGSNTVGGNLTVNGILTTTAGGTLDMGSTRILSGVLATINNNGIIITSVPTTTSSTPIPVGKSWGGTVEYTATTGLQTIVEGTYNNLTLRNTSNSNTAGGDLTVNGTLTTTAGGALNMGTTSILSGALAAITNNGTIITSVPTTTSATPIPIGKSWNGTIEYGATAGLQTIVEGTYTNLTLRNTSNSNTAGGNLTVNSILTTSTGGALDMGALSILSGTLATITNNGTIKTSVPTSTSTTSIPTGKTWSGTIEYGAPNGLQTIVTGTYNNLTLSNSSDTNSAGGNLMVNGTLTTTAGGTLDMGNTRILSGTLTTITNNGTIKTSVPTATSSTPIPTGKTWGGTIEYGDPSGLQTIVSGTYNNLTLNNTSGSNAAGGNITVNGSLTTSAGGTLDMGTTGILMGTLSTIANNGIIKTSVPTATSSSPIPSGKTWSGTIEFGATTGAQTIVTGTYGNLTLNNTSGSNTTSGIVTVNGIYASASGGTLATNNNVNFSGSVLCGGSISATAGTVTYGAAATNILSGTYYNLIIPDNAILCGNLIVNGAITLGTSLNYNSYTISGLLEVSSVSATNVDGPYKINDIIYVTVEFSKNVTVTGTPQLTLETGTIDQVINWDGGAVTNTLTFPYQIQAGDLSSDLDYVATNSLSLNGGTIKDASNNNADLTLPTPGTANSLGNNKDIEIDGVVPTLTYVHIQSNNPTNSLAKVGDVITLTFTGSEPLASKPTVTIATRSIDPADITNTIGNTWSATYTMALADATGNVPFTINYSDIAGNSGSQRTTVTDVSSVTFDKTIPTLSNVSIQSNNVDITRAKVGDIITLSFTGSETLTAKPTVNIANHNILAGNITNTIGNTWTATYQMVVGDNEGTIPFTIDFSDLAGNPGGQVLAVTFGSDVTFDRTSPTVSITSSKQYTNNNPFTLTITFNEDVKDFVATDVNVTYGTRGAFVATTPMRVWTLAITPDGGGNVQCSISASACTDLAGNNNSISNTVNVTYDIVAPDLNTVTIASDNAHNDYVGIGGKVTISIIASEGILLNPGDVKIAGQNALLSGAGVSWSAWYIMQGTDTEGVVDFEINFTDLAGNTGTTVTNTTNASTVTFDISKPVLTAVSIASSNILTSGTKAMVGDLITVAFTAGEKIEAVSASIKGKTAIVTNTNAPANEWEATYTMSSGDSDTPSNVGFVVNFKDYAGNTADPVSTTTAPVTTVTFDKTKPTLSGVSITSTNALLPSRAGAGHTIRVTFTGNEALQTPEVTIIGHVATVSNISGNQWRGEYTLDGTEPEGQVSFFINFADAVGNQGIAVSTVNDGTSVTMDKTSPILTSVSIASNNTTSSSRAVAGNTVTLSFTANEAIQTPVVTIAGQAATVSNAGGNSWTATYILLAGDPEGLIAFSISFQDMVSNTGTPVNSTLNGSSVTYDKTLPTLGTLNISSNYTNSSRAKVGSIITINFIASEEITIVSASILGQPVVPTVVSGNTWTANYTTDGTETAIDKVVNFVINFKDLAGNTNSRNTSTDGSSVYYDITPPVVNPITIFSDHTNTNMARIGSKVTVEFTSSETIEIVAATIKGKNAIVENTVGNTWQAYYFLTPSDTEGSVGFSITVKDLAGNQVGPLSTPTSGSVTFDKTLPSFSSVVISSNNAYSSSYAVVGNIVTLAFETAEDIENPTVNLNGNAATPTGGPRIWQATRTMTLGDNQGIIPFTIDISDLAGNSIPTRTTSTNGSSVTFDRVLPTLDAVSISSNYINTNLARTGSVITINFSASEVIENVSATVLGQPAIVTNLSTLKWKATYTPAGSETEGNVGFVINFNDLAGNTGSKNSVTDGSSVTYDKNLPLLNTITIFSDHSNSNKAKVGSKVTVEFVASETIEFVTATIQTKNAIIENTVGNTWQAYYYLTSSDNEGNIDFTLNYKDLAGNPGAERTSTTNATSVSFDKTLPSFNTVTISSNNTFSSSQAAAGDIVTLNFETSEAIEIPSVSINGIAASSVTGGPTVWVATRTIALGENEGIVPFTIDIVDLAGNGIPTRYTTTNGSSVNFDDSEPGITSITVNSGVYKVGSTIPVFIQADYNNYIGTTVEVNGLAQTLVNNNNNTYTVNYLVAENDNQINAQGNLPVNIVFRDASGNTSSRSEATSVGGTITVDTRTPQIAAVTSNAEADGILKIGDQLIFTVTPAVAETGLIITPTTYNGKPITWTTTTGATYTATYTVVEGDATQDPPLQIETIGIADVAGNIGTSNSYTGVLKTIYATNPTVTILGTISKCDYGQTVPVSFHLTGHKPFQLTYNNGTANIGPIPLDAYTYNIDVLSGTYTLVSLIDSTGNVTNAALQNAVITVNPLPVVTLNIVGSPFNNDAEPIELFGFATPSSGGIFSGNGVTANGYFHPRFFDVSGGDVFVTITYTYTNSNGCINSASNEVVVSSGGATINGLNSHYCNYDEPFTITATNPIVPTVYGNFEITTSSNGWEDNLDNSITINPSLIGAKTHLIKYSYWDGGTEFIVTRSFIIDSVGVNVDFRTLNIEYCEDVTSFQLEAINLYPTDGSSHFSGPASGFNPILNTNNAFFNPSLAPKNQPLEISYYYISPLGCSSDTIRKPTIVHSLPEVDFFVQHNYNKDIEEYVLGLGSTPEYEYGNDSTKFTTNLGVGILNNVLYPGQIPVGNFKIRYTVISSEGCTNYIEKDTRILKASDIVNLEASYCYSEEEVDISCVPVFNPMVAGTFSSNNGGITPAGLNAAKYSIAAAGKGVDTVFFRYNIEGTPYEVFKRVLIDSIGQVSITGIDPSYCNDAGQIIIVGNNNNHGNGNGNFTYTGAVDAFGNGGNIAFYTPLLEQPGTYDVTYKYVSSLTTCSSQTTSSVTINPVPNVQFSILQSCTGTEDPVEFINNTLSTDEIVSWFWNFGGTGNSTEISPSFTFASTGNKDITLSASTINGCTVEYDSTIIVGVVPKAKFAWEKECLTEEATILKSTTTESNVGNYQWVFDDGTTNEGGSLNIVNHLFENPGFHEVKLVITSTDNCKDSITKEIYIQPYINFNELPNNVYSQDFEAGEEYWIARSVTEDADYSWDFGLPDGSRIDTTASGVNAWFTNLSATTYAERSEVVSPCFDLSLLEKPMLKFNIWSSSEPGRDGAVIQYSTDQGITWKKLGDAFKGVNWFNSTTIQSQPGGPSQFDGWSGTPMEGWQSARYKLDDIKGQPNVRFRIVYAAGGNAVDQIDGFAFDDFWIGDRQQSVLVEYFANSNHAPSLAANGNMATLEGQTITDAIPVHYHTSGDPVNNLFPRSSSGREFFYGLSAIPYALANGNSPFNFTTFSENLNIVDVESLQDPKMLLDVSYTDGNEVEIVANVTSLVNIDSEDLLLFCAVVQPVVNISTGETYYNVVREFLPNSAGISLQRSWVANESKSFTFTYNPSADDVANGTRIVVMVQNVSTRKVYQSTSIDLTLTAKPATLNSIISTNVFPNPAKHNVTVEGSDDIMTVTIIDLSGRTVSTTKVNGRQTTIPVEGLSKGVYFMQIDFKNERTVRKFVKE